LSATAVVKILDMADWQNYRSLLYVS
jgi:hypothetical protein